MLLSESGVLGTPYPVAAPILRPFYSGLCRCWRSPGTSIDIVLHILIYFLHEAGLMFSTWAQGSDQLILLPFPNNPKRVLLFDLEIHLILNIIKDGFCEASSRS